MSVTPPRNLQPDLRTWEDYDRLAWEYYETLPLEEFMEATPQSTQKQITMVSLSLIQQDRNDLQFFNELLLQYPHQGNVARVVPDTMIVLGADHRPVRSNYPLALEGVLPLMVCEYVSPTTREKDYQPEEADEVTSFVKYEQHLQIPYYLVFCPEDSDLRVYHHDGQRYILMEPNTQGRLCVEELDMEIGLHEGWVRFWHHGQLLPLPVELRTQVRQLSQENTSLKTQITALASEKEAAVHKAVERLRMLVVTLAQNAGRDDIVKNASAAEEQQLEAWLAELEG